MRLTIMVSCLSMEDKSVPVDKMTTDWLCVSVWCHGNIVVCDDLAIASYTDLLLAAAEEEQSDTQVPRHRHHKQKTTIPSGPTVHTGQRPLPEV